MRMRIGFALFLAVCTSLAVLVGPSDNLGTNVPGIAFAASAPSSQTAIDIIVPMPLDPTATAILRSGAETVNVKVLLDSYRKDEQLSPQAPVTLCDVIGAAQRWIPTANTLRVPAFVPIALALAPTVSAECEFANVRSMNVPIDHERAGTLLSTVVPTGALAPGASPSSVPGPPRPQVRSQDLAAFKRMAQIARFPHLLEIGDPTAYYARTKLRENQVAPSYTISQGSPDRYVFVRLNFTLWDPPRGQYFQDVWFSVGALMNAGRPVADTLLPTEDLASGTMTTHGGVAASVNVTQEVKIGANQGWEEQFPRAKAKITIYGLGSPRFAWKYERAQEPLTGAKVVGALIELPRGSGNKMLSLVVDVQGDIAVPGAIPFTRHFVTERSPAARCFGIRLVSPRPIVQDIPTETCG